MPFSVAPSYAVTTRESFLAHIKQTERAIPGIRRWGTRLTRTAGVIQTRHTKFEMSSLRDSEPSFATATAAYI
jgi:hypothetical protein